MKPSGVLAPVSSPIWPTVDATPTPILGTLLVEMLTVSERTGPLAPKPYVYVMLKVPTGEQLEVVLFLHV